MLRLNINCDYDRLLVQAGLKQKGKLKKLIGGCDSFVVKTIVQYPTDINLLFDAMRCSIRDVSRYAETNNLPNWRQYQYNIRNGKQGMRKIQKMKHSTSKQVAKKLKREH